ncbi:unnamed protein product [Amoebophrya sp. A120]|nr:unnamed protein product [Amoebophrya sp. A120]|eukprot:GSA120T00021421001.1
MESSWRSLEVVKQDSTVKSRRSSSSSVSSSSPTSTSWQLSIRNEGEATFSPASITPVSGAQGGGLDLDVSPSAQSTASTTASLQMAGSDVDDVNAENRGTPRDDQYGHGSRNTVINTDASKVSSHDDHSRNDSEFVNSTHKRSSSSSSSLSSPNVTLKIDNMLDRVRDCLEVDDRTNASDLTSRSATTTVEDDKLTFFSPRPDFAFDTMLSPVSKNTDEGVERGRAIMAERKMKNPNYLLNRLSTITLDIREFLAPDRWTLASSITSYSSAGSGRHSSTTNINTASSTASLGVSVSSFVLDLSFSLGLCIPPVEAVEISVRSCIVEDEHRAGRLSESAAAPVPGTRKGEEVGSAFLETQRQDARRTAGSQGKSLEERQHCITEQSWEFPVGGGNLLSTQLPRSQAHAAPTQADRQVDVASAGDGAKNIELGNAGVTVERGQNGWLCTRPEKLSPVAQQQQVVKRTNSTSSTDCRNTPLTLDQDVWHTQIIGSFSEILAPGGCDLAEPAGTTGPRGGQLPLRELETTTRGRPSANLLRKLEVRLKSKNFCGKSPVPMECFSVYLPVVSES